MGTTLSHRIKQSKFESPAMEASLNVMVASDYIRGRMDKLCSSFGISTTQYNILRVLKGILPDGHPRCEIADRLIERGADVTRLIDKLEKLELVERDRSGADRRHSIARITQKGIELLDLLKPHVQQANEIFSSKLSDAECIALSRLCEKLYADGL